MVESKQALGLRLKLEFGQTPAGVQVMAYDPDNIDWISGPYAVKDIPADGVLWTETVFAERVALEVLIPPGVRVRDLDLSLSRIIHVYDFPSPPAKAAANCHGDPNCYAAWSELGRSVAAIASVNDLGFIFCTGTRVTDGTPLSAGNDYFLTANHCVTGQGEANTLEFFWLYQTPFCNGPVPSPMAVPRTGGGADYVAATTYFELSDFAFMRLRQSPTGTITRAPWSTTAPPVGEAVTVIHHPAGDYKRISFGNVNSFFGNYVKVRWSTGATEGGSSGSPLFNAAGRIIGQLYGGYSSCRNRNGLDDFGRFDLSFPRIDAWLNPPLRDRYVPSYSRDYNGDGRADLDLYWPEGGTWLLGTTTNSLGTRGWGWSETIPVPADYDGDGITDLAVFHPAGGTWYISQSTTKTLRQVQWGWSETIPVPGDYDGDGRADIAVFSRANGTWYIWQSGLNRPRQVQWGWDATLPVPADYDGDGQTDLAVFFPPEGRWYIWQSDVNKPKTVQWGWSEVTPVPADYDGDGSADIAVFHRPTARWFIAQSGGGQRQATWGWAETLPVPADYDGDGKTDIAVYWPREGRWYVSGSIVPGLVEAQMGWSRAYPVGPAR
jgi:hypothetical protein